MSAALLLAASGTASAGSEACTDCFSIRVGPPTVVRGPFADELDSPLAATLLPDGTLRVFTANATTYALDTADLFALRGERTPVLGPAEAGSAGECGRWINGVRRAGKSLFAFVHQESACDYDKGETHKSLALASSDDDGLTWRMLGDIITGADAPAAGRITGEGDCTVVDGHDGFLYAYCLRNSDWQTIVARAPVDDFGPGQWRKYKGGRWDEPGLGGGADAIGFVGTGTGYLRPMAAIAAVANDPWFGGLRLSLSKDKVHFSDVSVPILPLDGSEWKRPAATDLVAYAAPVDPADGGNDLGDRFLLSTVYLPPGADFASRYLVLQDVTLGAAKPGAPQVGVALSRWEKDGLGRVATGPVHDPGFALAADSFLGYLLPSAAVPAAVKLEECVKGSEPEADYLLAVAGTCEAKGYTRLRTAGFALPDPADDTLPLYACERDPASHFISNRPDCEGRGRQTSLLGYAFRE